MPNVLQLAENEKITISFRGGAQCSFCDFICHSVSQPEGHCRANIVAEESFTQSKPIIALVDEFHSHPLAILQMF